MSNAFFIISLSGFKIDLIVWKLKIVFAINSVGSCLK